MLPNGIGKDKKENQCPNNSSDYGTFQLILAVIFIVIIVTGHSFLSFAGGGNCYIQLVLFRNLHHKNHVFVK
ncbi:hypothetical protein SDC9_159034 [bioreactor metagenome]|uniref:Uncharacterized protein n=1 Tax=bioreactor metagenome TaxID=1076179 RepID=A0A645FDR0_9ZZZZ